MFRHVIVPLDGSRGAAQAIPIAARLAKCAGAGVVLLRVVEEPGADEEHLDAHLARPSALAMKAAARSLGREAERLRVGGIPTETRVEQGSAVERILAAAKTYPASIVVMRSRAHTGRIRLGLGSVARGVVQGTASPVLILPYGRQALPPVSPYEPLPRSPLRILVPLDGSRLAEAALAPACELLRALAIPGKGGVHLLQVVPSFAADAEQQYADATRHLQVVAERLQARIPTDAGLTVTWSVVFETEVPHAIVQVSMQGIDGKSAGFDIVAMTTHGQGGLERTILGSVTEQVLYTTRLPVLVVRPQAVGADHDDYTTTERAQGDSTERPLARASGQAYDAVLEASIESFPASDAPGWLPHRL